MGAGSGEVSMLRMEVSMNPHSIVERMVGQKTQCANDLLGQKHPIASRITQRATLYATGATVASSPLRRRLVARRLRLEKIDVYGRLRLR